MFKWGRGSVQLGVACRYSISGWAPGHIYRSKMNDGRDLGQSMVAVYGQQY